MKESNDKKFKVDLLYNYLSLLVLFASGFVFNIIIIIFYDEVALGIFNQAYAWYIVFSQITVFGIQASVSKYSAEYSADNRTLCEIFWSAAITVFLISIIVTGILEVILLLYKTPSAELWQALRIVVLALPIFSENKIVLSFLNGISDMKAYAFFQATRYILIAVALLVMAICRIDGEKLTICFLASELILLVTSIIYIYAKKIRTFVLKNEWVKKHLHFGIRIIPSNFVLELNTRVDVLCLGVLIKDNAIIGIYSFAMLFVEGMYQLLVVIRRNLNPELTNINKENRLKKYVDEIKTTYGKLLNILVAMVYVLMVIGYIFLCYLLNRWGYIAGLPIIVISALGVVMNAKYIIFGNILAQTGYPMEESVLNVITVMSNIVLNLVFIIAFGYIGAAIATALSYFVFSFVLRKTVYKRRDILL